MSRLYTDYDEHSILFRLVRLQIAVNIALVVLNVVWLIHVWSHG